MDITKELHAHADPKKAVNYSRFFKTGKGEYGEGDIFLGIVVPVQRKISRQYKNLSLKETEKLLQSTYHEYRLTALFILVLTYEKASAEKQTEIYELYMSNLAYINNWDLIDLSAPKIVGYYLMTHPEKQNILSVLAQSENLWERRIAIMATFPFIKRKQFDLTFAIAEMLIHDTHDLIHKAVGWMLREIGKIDQQAEEVFLKKYYKTMPRTMLRYAIEKFDEKKRAYYMSRA